MSGSGMGRNGHAQSPLSGRGRCTRSTLGLALVFTLACNRGEQDDVPTIKLPVAVKTTGPAARATVTDGPGAVTAVAPPAAPPPPPSNPPGHPQPQRLASQPGAPVIVVTPLVFQIPTSLVLPTSLPPLPQIPSIPGIPPLIPQQPPPAPSGHVTPESSDRVIVYGASWCGACRSLKKDLDQRGVPYTFIDVDDAHAMATPAGEHAAEMPADMKSSIPATRVVQKNGQPLWVSGADETPGIKGGVGDHIERAYRGT